MVKYLTQGSMVAGARSGSDLESLFQSESA